MIEARHLTKSYANNSVLTGINATINEGEFVTLVGSSGCGKSTFLKLLLGVEAPTSGELLMDGRPMKAEPGPDRGIVFQQYSVFPHLTVLGNVMATKGLQAKNITGYLFGEARKAAKGEAIEMLSKVGLTDSLDYYPHQLSGGMKQRLAIAQTLLANPRVLLLDEPFAALDPGIRSDMHKLVIDLWEQHELTVVMVTHSLQEGFYLGTRLLVFDKVNQKEQPSDDGATITYDLPIKHRKQSIPSMKTLTAYEHNN